MNAPVASVGIVCLRGGEALLVRRKNPPLQNQWSLPGGRIEWGETARAAALRELTEETGVEAELIGLIDVADGLFSGASAGQVSAHFVMVEFAARWLAGAPVAGDDAAEAAFFPLSALEDLGVEPAAIVIIRAGAALAAAARPAPAG